MSPLSEAQLWEETGHPERTPRQLGLCQVTGQPERNPAKFKWPRLRLVLPKRPRYILGTEYMCQRPMCCLLGSADVSASDGSLAVQPEEVLCLWVPSGLVENLLEVFCFDEWMRETLKKQETDFRRAQAEAAAVTEAVAAAFGGEVLSDLKTRPWERASHAKVS